MKIGILTFHRAENFGAVLQTYALQTYLEQNGHDVYIIDYLCPAIETAYHIFNPSILWSRKNVFLSIKYYCQRFYNIQNRLLKKRNYKKFREEFLKLTQPYKRIDTDLKFDAYIVGSDQIWNLHLTHGLDRHYFLDFPTHPSSLKIAYAASAEHDPTGLLSKHRDKISMMLNKFNAISVRETFLKNEIQKYTSKSIYQCIDPTCLLSKKDYQQLIIPPPIKKYILVYAMHEIPVGLELAKQLGKQHHCQVVVIKGGFSNSKKDTSIQDIGPRELLGWIAYARTVITSSFHGLMLSLIYKKNFWAINTGNNLRQRHILNAIGLADRLISKQSEYTSGQIDYKSVTPRLEHIVQQSKDFLTSALVIHE